MESARPLETSIHNDDNNSMTTTILPAKTITATNHRNVPIKKRLWISEPMNDSNSDEQDHSNDDDGKMEQCHHPANADALPRLDSHRPLKKRFWTADPLVDLLKSRALSPEEMEEIRPPALDRQVASVFPLEGVDVTAYLPDHVGSSIISRVAASNTKEQQQMKKDDDDDDDMLLNSDEYHGDIVSTVRPYSNSKKCPTPPLHVALDDRVACFSPILTPTKMNHHPKKKKKTKRVTFNETSLQSLETVTRFSPLTAAPVKPIPKDPPPSAQGNMVGDGAVEIMNNGAGKREDWNFIDLSWLSDIDEEESSPANNATFIMETDSPEQRQSMGNHRNSNDGIVSLTSMSPTASTNASSVAPVTMKTSPAATSVNPSNEIDSTTKSVCAIVSEANRNGLTTILAPPTDPAKAHFKTAASPKILDHANTKIDPSAAAAAAGAKSITPSPNLGPSNQQLLLQFTKKASDTMDTSVVCHPSPEAHTARRNDFSRSTPPANQAPDFPSVNTTMSVLRDQQLQLLRHAFATGLSHGKRGPPMQHANAAAEQVAKPHIWQTPPAVGPKTMASQIPYHPLNQPEPQKLFPLSSVATSTPWLAFGPNDTASKADWQQVPLVSQAMLDLLVLPSHSTNGTKLAPAPIHGIHTKRNSLGGLTRTMGATMPTSIVAAYEQQGMRIPLSSLPPTPTRVAEARPRQYNAIDWNPSLSAFYHLPTNPLSPIGLTPQHHHHPASFTSPPQHVLPQHAMGNTMAGGLVACTPPRIRQYPTCNGGVSSHSSHRANGPTTPSANMLYNGSHLYNSSHVMTTTGSSIYNVSKVARAPVGGTSGSNMGASFGGSPSAGMVPWETKDLQAVQNQQGVFQEFDPDLWNLVSSPDKL